MSDSNYSGLEKRFRQGSWHLEKNFSIGVIVALLAQGAGSVFFGGELLSDFRQLQNTVVNIIEWKDKQDDERGRINANLSALKQKLDDQGDMIKRIDDILENTTHRTR